MAEKQVYALNIVSEIVTLIDRRLLDHPTFGKNLIEVDTPDECISCGDQPKEVTTTQGEVIALGYDESYDTEEEDA